VLVDGSNSGTLAELCSGLCFEVDIYLSPVQLHKTTAFLKLVIV